MASLKRTREGAMASLKRTRQGVRQSDIGHVPKTTWCWVCVCVCVWGGGGGADRGEAHVGFPERIDNVLN